jgi:hypothetical protein
MGIGAGMAHTLLGIGQLFGGQRDTGDARAEVGGSSFGQRTPAATDLQQRPPGWMPLSRSARRTLACWACGMGWSRSPSNRALE